jgi:hypothetical protein
MRRKKAHSALVFPNAGAEMFSRASLLPANWRGTYSVAEGTRGLLAQNIQRTACETNGGRFCHFVGWQKGLLPALRTDAEFAFLVPGREGLMAGRHTGLRVWVLGLHWRILSSFLPILAHFPVSFK